MWQTDLFLDHLAGGLLLEVQIPLDPQAKLPPVGLQLVQGEGTPLVVPIPEDGDIAEKGAGLGVVFGGVPGARPGGIEELGDDHGVLAFRLRSDLGKAIL